MQFDAMTGQPIPDSMPQAPRFNPGRPATVPQRLYITQVNSRTEAEAWQIRPGAMHFFVDFSTGQIYMRRYGDSLNMEFYVFNAEPPEQSVRQDVAVPQTVQGGPQDALAPIMDRLARIEGLIGGLTNGVQSVRDGAGNKAGRTKSAAGGAGHGDGAGTGADAGAMAAG